MNKFSKISKKQYEIDGMYNFIRYDEIKLPKRATLSSAGYDIYSVKDFILYPGEEILLPTGINITLDEDKFLMMVPRSGLGFKYGVRLKNTTGVIDADYINSENEGHFWIKLDYPILKGKQEPMIIKRGDAICQGIICQYFKTIDDITTDVRNGDFGSTNRSQY